MKNYMVLILLMACSCFASAQDIEQVKTLHIQAQDKKAKEALDKILANPNFKPKADDYMLKAAVYAGAAMETGTKGSPTEMALVNEADNAFQKYQKMDPSMLLLNDQVYQNVPINIYTSMYTHGYADYTNKNWLSGFRKMEKAISYSDLLIARKIVTIQVDTNCLVLAGITAENAGLRKEAAVYYGRLADAKVGGKDYESVYRFLVQFHFNNYDFDSFEKYRQLGKSLYPESEYFNYDKVDFAVGTGTDLNKRIRNLERVVANEPSNFKAYEMMGELIYDTLNNKKTPNIQITNATELENMMLNAFQQAASLNPTSEFPVRFAGYHYLNKAQKINNAADPKYILARDKAAEYLEKTAARYGQKESLSAENKESYRNIALTLSDIYKNKKDNAANATDKDQFAAAEKKWNDLALSIK